VHVEHGHQYQSHGVLLVLKFFELFELHFIHGVSFRRWVV